MLRKIFHISDVHIRNFKRHEEYRRVFNTLYDYLKQNYTDQDLICLTGDIVHSKTDVTPELVQEVQSFFKSLADIGRVLLIPGNHDANLNNSHRLDSLTPIVNALNHPNLTYVKDTASIEIDGVCFSHWSVFDDSTEYIKPQPYWYNVCLFHGAVSGTTTEFGFSLINSDIKVSDFDGFDLVLLGDIHKTQYLNEEQTIAYPGSLIQQNHGEGLTHGILVWDVETKSSELVTIQNDTAFYTIEVDAGIYDAIPESLPKNLYLRVKYKNTNQSDIKKIVSDIKSSYNIIETSLIRIKDQVNVDRQDRTISINNVRDVEYQNYILTQYIKDLHQLDDKTIKDICEINKQLNEKLSKSEVARNSIWLPKSFEFSNMFSYGKDNIINFSNMQGVYGIFAPNASGKSTLLDSITYCIFDKCSKTNKGSQVMNNNSKTFHCKLVFEMNGLEYTIERNAEVQKSGNVRVEVDFSYKDEYGSKVSLNGKERNDTNKNIVSVVGNYEDFILTAISVQNNNTGFIDMNQKDRKDLLSQFLDINIFEELYTIASNDIKEVSVLIKEYQKEDYHTLLNNSANSIKEYDQKILAQKSELDSLQVDRDKKNQQILEETKRLTKVEVTEDINDLESQKDKLLTINAESEKSLSDLTSSINIKTIDKNKAELELDLLNIDEINIKLSELEEVEKAKNKKALDRSSISTVLDSMKVKLDQLKDLKYDQSCKFCMENVFVKDAIEIKETYPKQEALLHACDSELDQLTNLIKDLQSYKGKKSDYDKKTKQLQSIEKEIDKLRLDQSKLEFKIKQSKSLLDHVEYKIDLYKKQQADIENNRLFNIKIASLNTELTEFDKTIKQHNDSYTDLVSNKKLEENNKNRYEGVIQKLKELESKFKVYQYYLQSIHRDGIPHKLISNIIPVVEEEVNNILAQLVDFTISLKADDKNINAYICYSEDNCWPIELTSGMEKFISSLAIRSALINISTLPRPNFIAIDEGFGALDQTNLSSIVMLFDYLKTQFKFIMIISHIETMRDVVDHHVEINKLDGRSKIEQLD